MPVRVKILKQKKNQKKKLFLNKNKINKNKRKIQKNMKWKHKWINNFKKQIQIKKIKINKNKMKFILRKNMKLIMLLKGRINKKSRK